MQKQSLVEDKGPNKSPVMLAYTFQLTDILSEINILHFFEENWIVPYYWWIIRLFVLRYKLCMFSFPVF